MKKLNELQSYLTRLRGLMLTLIILCSIGGGNVWGITTSDLETSAATTLTDGSTYVVATAYNGTYLTTGVSSGWGTASTSIGSAAIFTAHGSESGFYLTCSAGRLVPAASKTFSAYDKGTSNNLSLSASGEIQNSSNTSWKLRLNTNFRWYSSTTGSPVYLFKIKSATPTVTPDPTSLEWGTVLQGSSQGNKTISITGANLTAGTLTISATGGYSVTPTSKSVSGTLAATTLTVTPPSTSTTGAKNGKVTISGGGLASAVEVNLSMTVNAASTVTWMVNGSEYTTTLVENGSKPTFPDNPTSCDGTSTTFYGWSTSEWAGKLDDVSAKTIYTSASAMPTVSGAVTYYAVFCKGSAGTEVLNEKFDNDQTIDATSAFSSSTFSNFSGETSKAYKSQYGGVKFGTSSAVGYITSKSLNLSKAFTVSIDACKYGSDAGDIKVTVGSTTETISNSSLNAQGSFKTFVLEFDAATSTSTVKIGTSSKRAYIDNVVITTAGTASQYLTTCCTDPGLNYGTGSVTKTFGEGVFTNTLTNSHGVAVTYSSSDETVATVNGSGQVTILKAGSTTITASSAAQTVAAVSYCADEASYTLTVNKANISPTLTYTPNSVAAGSNTSAPTVGGNPGSGGVTYAITSATPSGCATINTNTGVVTGVAVGSVTVTATVAATDNYNGNTATATVTITAASNFPNNKTIFIQAGKSGSAWSDNACVVAWFHSYGGSETAQPTYWLFDVTAEGDDKGKKLFAAVVPSSGDLPYLDINRYASNCTTPWNKNGGVSYSDASGSNTIRSEGSGNDQVYWNLSGVTIDLHGDPSGDEWASSLASFSDQGAGVWTATYNNYAPANAAGESQEFKAKTNYNGWIGNTGSNNNATLDGMHVGSTYNITATLDVTDHSLVMSKEFVKGTVHFDLQGHGLAISDLTNVTAGSKISAPGTPSATGYDFGGWYKEPACTNAWNFASDVVNETMTLYAKWTAHEYTITKTLTNVTSSPAIPSTYTYTGAAAGLNYTISPSDGYRLPTTITVTGTTYTWNPATGALAITGTISSNVTITIVAVQTHTVDWYVGGSAPANKIGDDGQTTVVDHGGKISDFPAHDPDGSACDKEFVGWTNTSSYVHGTSPLFNDVAGSPAINADANFYAVFAAGGDTEDEITVAETGATAESGTYSSWSDVSISSNAVYAGNTAGGSSGNASVQMRSNNSNSGIVTTASGGKVTKVVVDWNSSSANGRTLDIYGKNTAYTAATDLYDNSKQGTKLDSIVNGTSTELAISGDYSYIGLRSNSGAMYLNSITISWSSATGHTINCTSCANSVTVNYSDPGSGNTMAVTKGSTPIASGTSVKTCSAQSLTVTLTPATHYTVTNFEATGVAGVTTTNVGNVYTVSIPADKTGTLTLNPTFTPETPLTITLNTNNKGTFDPIGDVYSGESFTFPVVTPSDAECASFLGWIEGTTFDGAGETTDPSDVTSLPEYHAASTSSGTLTTNKTYTAVFGEKDTKETTAYVKVTSAPADWSGDYLIVRESIERAFNGNLETLDAANNYIDITIVDGKIAKGSLAANQFTIAKVGATDNYTIKSASGKYIGRTATSNGLDASTSTEYTNTLAYSSDHVVITSSGGPTLQMNGGTRFRYYASSQQELQLYKLGTAQMITYTYTTNPACTPRYRVTVNSAVGGSPSADKTYEHADEAITLTAHPAAGYSFTGWTITHTEGGAAASVTYTTGSASTETAVFEMPAYDVTVTASYAKIPVASLQVKDGETVIANSGTVNISTGANKTLTVVVTPADAFDHSWSASVTGGGTYANITNVQAGTFQVSGLVQGDATVTVTAPNDGDAKTVTFTVHVTDILPTEVVLKRDGSSTPISELSIYEGQYVKVNVSFTPTPTNKDFSVSADGTFVTIHAQAHTNPNYYATLNGKKVTTSPVNVTFTSAATSSVTKNLVVTVLPLLTDTFVDYIHGQATQTVSARLSADKFTLYTDINTPSLSDASDADPTSADCETSHYHLIGWLPKATAEALWAAGTAITESTEGLVKAGVQVEATGQTWYAIWGKEQ